MPPKPRAPRTGKPQPTSRPNPTDIPDSDTQEDYWDSAPIKKARWFYRRLDAIQAADSNFTTLCETSTVQIKGKVAVLDASHAWDYANNAFQKGTFTQPCQFPF